MNDAQIISIAVTVLAIFAGSLYNNARIGDMAGRFGDVKEVIRAEMRTMHAELNGRLDRLEAIIERNQETVMRMLADHDQQLSKLRGGNR